MPWIPVDAKRHTKKAAGGRLAALWAEVANRRLKQSGDDASAVRLANYVVKRARSK